MKHLVFDGLRSWCASLWQTNNDDSHVGGGNLLASGEQYQLIFYTYIEKLHFPGNHGCVNITCFDGFNYLFLIQPQWKYILIMA